MWATIVTVLETVKSFWKLASKNKFPKLKEFALTMRWTFGNTYSTCVRPRIFSTLKQVKSTVKTEIECRSATRGGGGAGAGDDALGKFSPPPLKNMLDIV